MLILYSVPASLYCAKTRILLRHKQLLWSECVPPGGYGSAEYRQIVVSGNLPALQDGDLLISDSEVIAEYLEEKNPYPSVLQGDVTERAQIRELSRFHDTRLEPEVRKLFSQVGTALPDSSLIDQQVLQINARLAQLGQLLGNRPQAGMILTLADCGYPVTFIWIDELAAALGFETTWPDAVFLYRRRLGDLPAIAAEFDSYCPDVRDWFSKKLG